MWGKIIGVFLVANAGALSAVNVHCGSDVFAFCVGEMLTGTTSFGGAVVFTSRPRIQRYTKTGVFVCVRTLFVTLPSTTAESPPRPCDAMTMRSQSLSEAAAIMA